MLIPSNFGTSPKISKFPKNLRLQSCCNLRGNSDTLSMVIINQFRFSCYERKLCQNLKSPYIFCPRMHLFFRTPPDERVCTFIDWFPEMLVNCSMLWQRINARPVVTILFLRVFDKTNSFSVLIFCEAPVTANQYISTQK